MQLSFLSTFSFQNWHMETWGLKSYDFKAPTLCGKHRSLALRMTQSLSSLGWIIRHPPGASSWEEVPWTGYVRLQFSNVRDHGPLAHKAFVFFSGFHPDDNTRVHFELFFFFLISFKFFFLDTLKTLWVLQNDIIVLVLIYYFYCKFFYREYNRHRKKELFPRLLK